jgi:hypothetical protein
MSVTTSSIGARTPASLAMDGDPSVRRLGEALLALEAAAIPFAVRMINDDAVRQQYRRSIRDAVQEILSDVEAGKISPDTGAVRASDMRNSLMELSRLRTSDAGRAMAERLKAQGKTLPELITKYARDMFAAAPESLTTEQNAAVMRRIIEAAARDNPVVTNTLRGLSWASRGLVALSVGLAVYEIYRSPDPVKETGHQAVVLGAGAAGSIVVGALGTSLVCGPGAPVCAGVFILVGGAAFALGADYWWHR